MSNLGEMAWMQGDYPQARVCYEEAIAIRRIIGDSYGLAVAQHNLATDGSFNEFHLVLCRNVLIYFGRELQDRVLRLFDQSLPRRGVLALGRAGQVPGIAARARQPISQACGQGAAQARRDAVATAD